VGDKLVEMILNITVSHWVNILFLLLACLMNAGMDSLKHSFKTSFAKNWNEQFWNPALSWKNKRKTKLPDALTDGWHILKMLMLGFFMIALSYGATATFCYDLFLFTVYAVVWNVPFPYMYYKLRGRKEIPDDV
jgi:hypothetical protein